MCAVNNKWKNMALDKAIEHNHEWRKPYKGSKKFDITCRNHGRCPYCRKNRLIQDKRQREKVNSIYKEWLNSI